MKKYFQALLMCRSMFCAIPCPWNRVWNEEARDKMLLFLPVIGLEMGAVWLGIGWICRHFALTPLITGLLLSVHPFLATGFLHLDGYMDVIDAVKSCRGFEERRRILKDSHVGAFAVIGVVLLVVAQFAVCGSFKENANLCVLLLIPVVSRCCSALAVTILSPMDTSQYAGQKKSSGRVATILIMLVAAVSAGFVFWGLWGFVFVGELAGYGLALRKGYKALQGINGDICGYALTISELAALFVMVFI